METFEAIELEVQELKKRLEEVHHQTTSFYVFGANQEATETELGALRSHLGSLVEATKKLSGDTKARYQASQQLVPTDLGQQLTALELAAESAVSAMEEKQREQKRARTTRSDYNADVDEVQTWIRAAELKVQNRSIEPSQLKEQLQIIQNEIGPITDKLERLTRNGQVIIENTKDGNERELIKSTVNNLTEQLAQVRSWLEEKKQQVSDTLDAWQRFLALHEAVVAWIEEKRIFLVEPLQLSTLIQARQRLHDYSVGF